MKLPFLKNKKMPRVATEPQEDKLVNGSASDHLEDHCIGEMFDAFETKNVSKLRSALDALVMDMFDFDGEDHA